MAIPMVEIVNPNGLKGLVPEGSHAADVYPRSPSTRDGQDPDPDDSGQPVEKPAANASTEVWRAYAVSHGLTADQAAEMSRDDLAHHHYTDVPED